jgi:hypothetical protein
MVTYGDVWSGGAGVELAELLASRLRAPDCDASRLRPRCSRHHAASSPPTRYVRARYIVN